MILLRMVKPHRKWLVSLQCLDGRNTKRKHQTPRACYWSKPDLARPRIAAPEDLVVNSGTYSRYPVTNHDPSAPRMSPIVPIISLVCEAAAVFCMTFVAFISVFYLAAKELDSEADHENNPKLRHPSTPFSTLKSPDLPYLLVLYRDLSCPSPTHVFALNHTYARRTRLFARVATVQSFSQSDSNLGRLCSGENVRWSTAGDNLRMKSRPQVIRRSLSADNLSAPRQLCSSENVKRSTADDNLRMKSRPRVIRRSLSVDNLSVPKLAATNEHVRVLSCLSFMDTEELGSSRDISVMRERSATASLRCLPSMEEWKRRSKKGPTGKISSGTRFLSRSLKRRNTCTARTCSC